MSTKKNANVNAKKNVETKKENVQEKKLTNINLAQFAKELSNVQLKEKKVKETIYVYPEGWTKDKINSDEGKKFRNKLRNKLKSHCNNILYYAKTEDKEKLQSEINSFLSFYKTNYRINDLTISSITNSEKREKDIELMIKIVKEFQK